MKHIFALLLMGFFSLSVYAQTVTNLNDSGPGSLRGEILAANPGDVITFSPSLLANGSDTLTLVSDIIINKGLTLRGTNTATDTIYINGGLHTRLFYVDIVAGSHQSLTLDNLALVRGRDTVTSSHGRGGALYVQSADSVNVIGCLFKDNENHNSGRGSIAYIFDAHVSVLNSDFVGNKCINSTVTTGFGGFFVEYGSLLVDSSRFVGQRATTSGPCIVAYRSPLRCTNSIFHDNVSTGAVTAFSSGGAIFSYKQRVYIDHCVFTNNKATNSGAAVYVYAVYPDTIPGNDTVQYCHFKGNEMSTSGGHGGTLLLSRGYVRECTFESNSNIGKAAALRCWNCEIQNTTISGNSSLSGGALAVRGKVKLKNVTITDNTSNRGVITPTIINSTTDTVIFSNTILAGNHGADGVYNSFVQSEGYNVFYGNPSTSKATDITLVRSGLGLEPLAMNGGLYPTHVPLGTSVAYNAGDSTDFSFAQNGPIYGRRDIGAAERQVIVYDTAYSCDTASWWGTTYASHGTYMDTAYNANTIDSVGVLVFERYQQNFTVSYIDTLLIAQAQDSGTTYQWIYCDGSNTPISGATDSIYQPTANGSYAVVLTNGNCIDTSACVAVTGIGLMEQNPQDEWVRFYPNPTSGILQIDSDVELSSLQVFNLSGREVAHYNMKGQTQISLHELKSGLYLLKWVDIDGRMQVDRVVVKGI